MDRTFQLNLSAFDSTTATVAARVTISGAEVDDILQKVPFAVGEVWKRSGHQVKEAQVRAYVRDIDVDAAAFPLGGDGWTAWPVAGVQCVTGPFAGCVAGAFPLLNICGVCCLPGVFTVITVWVGNYLGKQRAALAWPLLVTYAVALVVGILPLAALFVATTAWLSVGVTDLVVNSPTNFQEPTEAEQAKLNQLSSGYSYLFGIGGTWVSLMGIVASLASVPITYALVAEPKRPGDDGISFPDLFADRAPSTAPEHGPAPARVAAAGMRF